MKKFFWVSLALLLVLPALASAQERIEKIEIAGNDRVTRETILYYLSSREGDFYSEDMLKKDLRVLWSTGFFSNVRIEEQPGATGRVVKIIVEENPVIKSISFKTGKKLKEDDISNKLKEKDEYILPYSYYSASKVQKVRETITSLLLEKGMYAAKVEVETSRKGKNEVDLAFKIDEGPRVRVAEVVLTGTPVLPQSILLSAMKSNRPHGLISWVAGSDVYKENKLTEDLDKIKAKFQEYGYMEAAVGKPQVEQLTKRTILRRKQTMLRLAIPVSAGDRYTVWDVSIEGNKAVTTAYLRSLIKLKKGDIYNVKRREKSVESISEAYRNVGFLYAQIMPVESLDPKNKRVSLVYNLSENEVAYLNRLEFRGNTFTKDKVIRREMIIREGDRFSLAMFKDSLLRIKQLGLVDVDKDPEIKPDSEDLSKINATVNVKELQRNNIQFSAGYSGYEGYFIAASYSTVNFLGGGENVEVTAQYGGRVKNYVLGLSEPYFMDLPITLGFNLYSRYIDLPFLYARKDVGADIITGARIRGYIKGNLTYSYSNIRLSESTYTGQEGLLPYSSSYYGYYYGAAAYGFGNYNVSALIPTIYRSTIDSPITPHSGMMYLLSAKFAGGPLGGEVDFIKPKVEFTIFQPTLSRQVFGFHLSYEFIRTGKNSQIPFWERFYLGGERDIRGYEIYSLGPRSDDGYLIGGVKSLVLNFEYQFQIGGPLNLILFHDMGNTYLKEENPSFGNLYTSSGIEARIFVPALRVPFRLIFAYNNRLIYSGDSHVTFRFAIGTTF
ncbi:MAG: outer membrane protein assembly factor BamA [Candidatus Aminicenantes bacterium RBG_16_63_16]|nr:MAG: outer membrane protein assembly factor BamA [Candidatus Aminicenantes bacterium RBG_16_63_16]